MRDGLAGCTARSIADAGPLTKSAIHYYFSDIDLLIDRAVAALVTDFLTELRRVAEKYDEPRERLWAVLETYLDTFAEHPNAAFAWFEYWVAVGRADNVAAAEVTLRSVIELLTDLLGDVGIDDPRARARALQSYLLGAVVQQHVRRRPFAVLREEIELLCLP